MTKREYPEWMGKMRGLTPEEITDFLSGPVVARIAMIKPDGRPYVASVWQEWDGEVMYIVPRAKAAFVPYLQANPYVCVSCVIDVSPFTRVMFEGKVEFLEGPVAMTGWLLELGQRMSLRYLGPHGPEYLESSRDRPRYLLKMIPEPEKTKSWEGVEWHPKYLDTEVKAVN
jgi:hypothetical protein